MNYEQILGQSRLNEFYDSNKSWAVANKIGGDNMWLMLKNAEVMQALEHYKIAQSYAVSAFRSSTQKFNTTNHLLKAQQSIEVSWNTKIALSILETIEDFHIALIDEILESQTHIFQNEIKTYIWDLFQDYKENILGFDMVSVGEMVWAKVLLKFLEMRDMDAVLLDTSKITNLSPDTMDAQVTRYIKEKMLEIYTKNPQSIIIMPGYIGGTESGIIETLGRWYTDYTWARSAVAMHDTNMFDDVVLYIQKLYGFCSTDPNKLSWTSSAQALEALSYDLSELSVSKYAAGARLINPFALKADIQAKFIEILVWNPTDTSPVTRISQEGNPDSQWVDLILPRAVYTGDMKEYKNLHIPALKKNNIISLDPRGTWDNAEQWKKTVEAWEALDPRNLVYMMWENLWNISDIFWEASQILGENDCNFSHYSSNVSWAKPYMVFVFSNEQKADIALKLLHKNFIENTYKTHTMEAAVGSSY